MCFNNILFGNILQLILVLTGTLFVKKYGWTVEQKLSFWQKITWCCGNKNHVVWNLWGLSRYYGHMMSCKVVGTSSDSRPRRTLIQNKRTNSQSTCVKSRHCENTHVGHFLENKPKQGGNWYNEISTKNQLTSKANF